MKQNEEIKRLFKLYLEGKANSRQQDILFRYLADSKNKDSEFHALMNDAWLSEPTQRDHSPQATKGLSQIWERLENKKQIKLQRYQLLKYAASVLLVVSAAFGWYNFRMREVGKTEPVIYLSKTTAVGEKVKMVLPDSSVVFLSGSSKLTWPNHFAKGSRRIIRLEGEGFFEVKRDTTSPFIVNTGKMQTQVLGTSFNIYAYSKDQVFSVAVRTGKVRVSENTNGKFNTLKLLTPGMKLIYHENNGNYAVNTVKVNDVNSWIANRFVFRNESFDGMLARLERYYNVRFEVKTTHLVDCKFNATFSNKSIKDVMEQLRIMSGNHIRYKISADNKTITLKGEGCQ